tara:strand:+ start:93 stop:431 length:339 start_codon:yes stop_codon:yes gene_type:complete
MLRSAPAGGQFTVVVTAVLVLLLELGSVDEVETVATFEMVELHVALLGTVKAIANALLCPLASVMLLHRTFVPFTAQVESDSPLLKVKPEGIASAILTVWAVSGPAFVRVAV